MFPCLKKELAIADFFAPSASLPADCRGLIVGQDSWLAAQRAAAIQLLDGTTLKERC